MTELKKRRGKRRKGREIAEEFKYTWNSVP
jgi:hypothetical protein